jgi:N-acetylglucosaminyldiphosphoundecaprenol N-acetyl-beta-D-mannosaminyltransferase
MIRLKMKFGLLEILDASKVSEVLHDKQSSENRAVHFVNAFVLAEAQRNRPYFDVIKQGHCFCDSRPLELYSKFVKTPVEQLRGIDFMKANLPNQLLGGHLIIGGTLKSEQDLLTAINSNFKAEIQVSFHQPIFSDDLTVLSESSLRAIDLTRPKSVWIGVGTPKQDYLSGYLWAEGVENLFCVGAAVTFLSGEVTECPKWVRRMSLEWLYRLLREPERLWRRYFFGNWIFISVLFLDLVYRIGKIFSPKNRVNHS